MKSSNILAVITARGGSKRIPKKNIKLFCGAPIISYSIKAAINSNLFDEIMVSTDSEEIKDIAIKYGANVPFMRDEKTSNDYATTYDVLEEVLGKYNSINKHYDVVCCIYPTAPFINSFTLKQAFTLLDDETDAVIPVVKYSYPPQRGFVIKQDKLEYNEPKYEKLRSQDLEPIYHDCGQFYFVKTESLLRNKSLVCPKTKGLIMDEIEVQDIDNDNDWKIAEIKYNLMKGNI